MVNRIYGGEAWWVEGARTRVECLYRREAASRPTRYVVAIEEPEEREDGEDGLRDGTGAGDPAREGEGEGGGRTNQVSEGEDGGLDGGDGGGTAGSGRGGAEAGTGNGGDAEAEREGRETEGAPGGPGLAAPGHVDTQAPDDASSAGRPEADTPQQRGGAGGEMGWRQTAAAAAAAVLARVASRVGNAWGFAKGIGASGTQAMWDRATGKRSRDETDRDGEMKKKPRTGDG